jgi:hypothetical protein
MNALVKPSANPFEAYGLAASTRRIVGKLLKFSKGDFLAGQDADEVKIGTRVVPIMASLQSGYIKWLDNTAVEHVMGPIAEGYVPPRRDTLGDTDESQWETDDRGEARDPWQLTNQIGMVSVDDPKDVFTFATSSRGGMGAIGELCKTYGRHMREAPDQYPVVELGVGSYQHRDKSFGRIKFPTFAIVDWVDAKAYVAAYEEARGSDGGGSAPATVADPVVAHQKAEMAAKAARRGVKLADTF